MDEELTLGQKELPAGSALTALDGGGTRGDLTAKRGELLEKLLAGIGPINAAPEPSEKLTAKQREVVGLLLAGRTQREAAAEAGVVESTVSRWKHRNKAFQASLHKGWQAIFEAGMAELLQAQREAVQALREIVNDHETYGVKDRLQAIGVIMRYCSFPRASAKRRY